MTRALEETPYGLCVYESDNDVPDHQTISIQYSAPSEDVALPGTLSMNGNSNPGHNRDLPPMNPTVSFTIVAHTDSICMRKTTLYFEHGEVIGDMSTYTVSDFRDTGRGAKRITPPRPMGGGHAGGDWALTNAWLKAINEHEAGQSIKALGVGASVHDQLRVFLTGFAIEEARKGLKVVDFQEFEKRVMESHEPNLAGVVVEYEPEQPSSY
jgi:hypothetical protein